MLTHMTAMPNTVEELKLYNSYGIIPPGVAGLADEGKTTAAVITSVGQAVKDISPLFVPGSQPKTITMPVPQPQHSSGIPTWAWVVGGVALASALGFGIFKVVRKKG